MFKKAILRLITLMIDYLRHISVLLSLILIMRLELLLLIIYESILDIIGLSELLLRQSS